MSKDTAIKAGTYCPVCRGVVGTDCWHDANQFHAESGYLEKLLKAKDEIESLKQQVEQSKRDAAQEGWAVVPKEPTVQMLVDMARAYEAYLDEKKTPPGDFKGAAREAYSAAIAAAPKQEK